MNPKAIARYENGASLHELARDEGVATRTLRKLFVDEGVEIRSHGRPNLQQGHRGPSTNHPLPHHVEPRYSCGHKRTPSMQCRICDSCQCTPKHRRPVRRYSGGWLCRCGKVIEP